MTINLNINYNKCVPEGHLDSLVDIKENIDTYPITAKTLYSHMASLSALFLDAMSKQTL